MSFTVAMLMLLAGQPELERVYDRVSETRRAGKKLEAARAFEELGASHLDSSVGLRALATAGAIWHWDLGDLARAAALYDRVLLGPDDRRGVMPALIGRLEIERATLGVNAELALIRRLEARRPAAEYAPWLLLRAARLLAEELDDPATAIGMLERVRAEHAESTYGDDALFEEARLLRRVKRPREALLLFGAIVQSKRSSLLVGSYNSVYLDDAYFEIAETLRIDLRDEALAEKAYLELVEGVPDSILVDDALHQARLLASARGDMKKAVEYIDRLRKLRPASRYL